MSIEIKIPKEIKDYKEKFLFGLTVKQFVSLALALAICVPLYIFGKNFIPEEMVSWLIIIIAAPILGIGFVKYQNMTFIQVVKRFFSMTFNPQRRKYTELPVFWYCREKIIHDRILVSEIKRKEYLTERKKQQKQNKAKYKKYIFISEKRKGYKSER